MAAMVRPPQLAVSLMRCTKLKALDLSLNSMREGAGLLSQDNLKLLLQAGVYTPIGWPQIVLPAVKNVRGHIEGMFRCGGDAAQISCMIRMF